MFALFTASPVTSTRELHLGFSGAIHAELNLRLATRQEMIALDP